VVSAVRKLSQQPWIGEPLACSPIRDPYMETDDELTELTRKSAGVPVPVIFPNQGEGGPGPSLLGTGDCGTVRWRPAQISRKSDPLTEPRPTDNASAGEQLKML
jgi:hypothetical protein